MPSAHILVVPCPGQGHLFPCIELSKRLASLSDYKITLVTSYSFSVSQHDSFEIVDLSSPDESDSLQNHGPFTNMAKPFNELISRLSEGQDHPIWAIVDTMISWTKETCQQFNIPTISFFTNSATQVTLELGLQKLKQESKTLATDEVYELEGLPLDMSITSADVMRFSRLPGGLPPWLTETHDSIGFLVNTCTDLEGVFIDYAAKELRKPVWGVGPLLPEQYWQSAGKLIHDEKVRSDKEFNVKLDEVKDWLDSKPSRSVIYAAFGSFCTPTEEESKELALALEESNQPFIWVIQPNRHGPHPVPSTQEFGDFFPEGFTDRTKGRGIVIKGWAPQLLILSHPSTSIFISHCGWNSTMEAIGRGILMLTWPIRGDQPRTSKLLVSHLKVGLTVRAENEWTEPVKKVNILQGIEELMDNDEIRNRAKSLQGIFDRGFPLSSVASLGAFSELIKKYKSTSGEI